MTKTIGLMDYDALRSRFYKAPNYDLGVTYAYLKQNIENNVRLISSTDFNNLVQYDKIYVFKEASRLPHPSSYIPGYYKLPIEEYGPGFADKPLRPFLLETRDLSPDCSCYNNIILFSLTYPRNALSWIISKKAKGKRYQPTRLYEKFEGEDLKKDYPKTKYCLLYDDPVEILNNAKKFKYYNDLLNQKHKFLFAHDIDISKVTDTIILEQVFSNSKYTAFRQNLMVSAINDNVKWLFNTLMSKANIWKCRIAVRIPIEEGRDRCLEAMLIMNYYNHGTHFKLKLVPTGEKGYLEGHDLALLAFEYLTHNPQYMSYYEYVFNISYLRKGIPKELIHTGEDRYEYIFKNYGMSPLLVLLEEWIRSHPQFEEYVFIGGSSKYEECRRKYYDKRRGGFNIKSTIDNISA